MSAARTLLFFAPHVALVLIVVIGEVQWLDWLWPFLIVSLALPWWCRLVGAGWSKHRSFALGPGLLVGGYLVGFVIALVTATELPFFAFAVLAVTVSIAGYSLAIYLWRTRDLAFVATIAGPAIVVIGHPVLGIALTIVAFWVFARTRNGGP